MGILGIPGNHVHGGVQLIARYVKSLLIKFNLLTQSSRLWLLWVLGSFGRALNFGGHQQLIMFPL